MTPDALHGVELVAASVPVGATFREAAEELASRSVATVAVLGEGGRVAGLFGSEHLLRGLFPPYLAELRHTAFAPDDLELLARRLAEVEHEPVTRHMGKPVSVDTATSAIHVAERFLHCEYAAIAVLEDERFVGMLDRAAFCRAMLRRL